MGRTVADTRLLLGAMMSGDRRDPMAHPRHALAPHTVDLASLRIAISADLGFAPVAPSIRRVFQSRMSAIQGAFAAFVAEDPDMNGVDRAYRVIRCANFLAAHRVTYERDPLLLGRNTRGNYEEGLGYSLADFAHAHAEQTRIYRAFQGFFERHDLLLLPCQALTPFPKTQSFPTDMEGLPLSGYFDTSGVTYGISITGHPSICIPCGRDEYGMPFGLQVVGPSNADGFTLDAAAALEALFATLPDLARPIPDIAALQRASREAAL
jgi:Asp-tRNA(Asn)/Glu-tRNA(Gln) amidotransferase A subunit family amidase